MKANYYSLFDSFRGEVHSDDNLPYLLINETVKKVALNNNLDVTKIWEDVLSSTDPGRKLSSILSGYGLKKIAQFYNFSIPFNYNIATKLANFSIKTRQEPLLSEIEFLEVYERFLSSRGGAYSLGIPNELFKLMHLLAETKNASSVYDGTLYQVNNLISTHVMNSKAKLYAETPYEKEKIIAELISFLYLENEAFIEQGNVLLHPSFTQSNYELLKFDSIVMAPPMGLQMNEDYTKNDRFGRFDYGRMSHRDSTFGFIGHAIASMNEKGKACVMVSSAPLFRGGREEEIRKALLQDDLIDGIIQLPAFILFNSGIAPFLIVLNKDKASNDKGKIKLLNASDMFTQKGRRKVLIEDNVKMIIHEFLGFKEDSSFCRKMEITEVIENSCNLVPDKYFLQESIIIPGIGEVQIKDDVWKSKKMVEIEEIAYVSNGVNIKSSEQGRKVVKVIKASDIQNGDIILEQIEEQTVEWKINHEKGIVQPGDLLMLSKGTNVKMAVMPGVGEDYIASVNLMIIRPKEGVNPYFLQLYLESPFGQLALERIKSGGTIAMWPLKEFKKIQIPTLSKEDQDAAAKNYNISKQNYIKALEKAEEDKAQEQLQIYQKLGLLDIVNYQNN